MKNADVSVVIPAYNSAALLPRCIASVLTQTQLPMEIIVVDDGSSDNTYAVVSAYGPSVTYLSQQNAGCAAARNRGIKTAVSHWIAFLDADDRWLPEKLESQLKCAESFPEASLIYCDAFVCDLDGKIRGRFLSDKGPVDGWVFDRLLESCFILPSTALVRKECLTEIGHFNETLRSGEDYDLWLRLSRKFEFRSISEALVYYERQPNSTSMNHAAMARNEVELLSRLLETQLSSEQRQKVSKRLAHNLFNLAYEIRDTCPAESARAAWRGAYIQPRRLAIYKLLVRSLCVLIARCFLD